MEERYGDDRRGGRRFGASRRHHTARMQPSGGHSTAGGPHYQSNTCAFERVAAENSRGGRQYRSWEDERDNFNFSREDQYDRHERQDGQYDERPQQQQQQQQVITNRQPKYTRVQASGKSVAAPGSSIMQPTTQDTVLNGQFRPPERQDPFLSNLLKRTAENTAKNRGSGSRTRPLTSSLEAASAPAPKIVDISTPPTGTSGWINSRQTPAKTKPRMSLRSPERKRVTPTEKRQKIDSVSVISAPTNRYSLRDRTPSALKSLTTFSANTFSLRVSTRPARLGKRRVTTEGSAAEPIALDSDSDSEPEMQSGNASNNTSKTPTDLTKQRAEDDEEKEAAIDLKEIEKFSTAKIYGCEVMIGLFQCMMDLFFQNDRVCMSNVRGKYEKWPFKSYYLLSYDRLQDVRLYGVSKETDADVDMEIEEPGKMDQLLDEASFLVFKYPLSDEDDRNAVMSFYDPTGSDILKGYIMLRPVEDATGDTDLEDIKDILRGHTDVTPIDGKEQAKEYLQNLMKDPFSYRSNGRKSGGKEEEQSSSESEEDSDDGIPVLTYPLPPCTSDIVTIIRHDVSRLKPRRYLNDNIIDYYFKRMMLEDFRANEIVQEKVLFLSSHFYSRLRVGRGPTQAARLEAGYKNVSTWLARSNFFNRSMIFIPINKDLHWSLAVIVNPRIAATHKDGSCMQGEDEAFSCIAVLDPLGSYHRKAAIVRNLRAFLRLEWETHKGRLGTTNLPEYGTDRVLTISVKAPMQRNSYDCGVYVLKFAEVMLKNCVELELLSLNNGVISTEVTDADLETLISPTAFSPDDISATRKQIRQHIAEDTVKFQELMEQKQQQKAAKASSMSSK